MPLLPRHAQILPLLVLLAACVTPLAANAHPTTNPATTPTTRPTTGAGETVPKNIILLIADGGGYNLETAVRYWTGQPLAVDGPEWNGLSMSTYSLRRTRQPLRDVPADAQDPALVFDPKRAYDPTPVEGSFQSSLSTETPPYPRAFAGYEWHRRTYPESANTASALMTGVSTFNGAINVDGHFEPVTTIAEVAKARGKRVGVVSTVPFSHATPAAAAGVHNESRDNYHQITDEMLSKGVVDVIAGAGHPEYDNAAQPRATAVYSYISESDWQALVAGTRTDDKGQAWTLVQELAEIEALATGETPENLFIVAPVAHTLQQKRPSPDRSGNGVINERDAHDTLPGQDPLTPGLPTLIDLTNAALNAVDDDPDGFFLMIEAGGTDWASHHNQLGRAIEEYLEFDAAVAHVSDYLDNGTNGHTWENTLVIVTSDHDQMLFGPEADTIPFQPLVDHGPGRLPGHMWLFESHSALPVPLHFRGPGSEAIKEIETKIDAYDDGTHRHGRGAYFHQAKLGKLLKQFAEE